MCTGDFSQPSVHTSHIQPGRISSTMSPDQIASLLSEHGLEDVTHKLKFELRGSEPLERGGFGSIYRGELEGGHIVAIKRIDPWRVLKLEGKHCKYAAHELYTWSKCDYRGILKVLGFALSEGFILLVSPWMENGSLVGHLTLNKPCNKLEICIDLAGTVEYLHSKGIVHGDIKADNILVSGTGDIQLVDFGNATLVEYVTLIFTCSSPLFACSVRFTAPEILDDSIQQYTAESDIYALGMTILQILTEKVPYANDSEKRALANVLRGILPPRPKLDEIFRSQCAEDELWSLLKRCWGEPSLRPTATEVKNALIGIKEELRTPNDIL